MNEVHHPTQVENSPNFIQKQSYESYRSFVDASSHGEGNQVSMPRIGVFDEKTYDRVINDDSTVFTDEGMPLLTSYATAYPHYNKNAYPHLVDAGYLLLPLHGLTDADIDKIRDSNNQEIIAEIVIPNAIDYSQPWEISIAQLEHLYPFVAEKIAGQCEQIDWATAMPFDLDGKPIIHHVMGVTLGNVVPTDNPDILDSRNDRQEIINRSDELMDHHVDSFSHHSSTATIIELDQAAELKDMIIDESWDVIALNKNGKLACAVFMTNDISNTPWIDPASIEPTGSFWYIDTISTNPQARREGNALNTLLSAFTIRAQTELAAGIEQVFIPFDTAGESTYSVPSLAKAVFDMAGSTITGGKVDIIANISIKPDVVASSDTIGT